MYHSYFKGTSVCWKIKNGQQINFFLQQLACSSTLISFLNDQDNALDGNADCQYMFDVGGGLLPNILIGIRE